MFQKTELEWDNYIVFLERAINISKFAKRAEIKPMATPKGAGESHLTSRASHQRLAAEIIKRLSKELGLNEIYAYAGMLMHDAGHPFSAHEGEEYFNLIGRIENCGFFHHNAKGVEVILNEDICEKAINMIPGIENNPELRAKLEDEFYYLLDLVISHDGEATKSDFKKEATQYSSIKEAVLTKLMLSNSQNNYKFIAQTNEGKLAKVADVLAYLPTDITDGFRLGIIKGFNDDYLELIGRMFANDDTLDRKGNIEFATKLIDSIKERKLRELEEDMNEPANKKVLGYAKDIIKEAKQQGLNISALSDEERDKLDELIDRKIQEIQTNNPTSNYEEEQMQKSDMVKLREFTSKMLSVSTDVVAEVTNRMEEYFVEDFIATSKKEGRLVFSKNAEDLFYKLKKYNYLYIVQYTKWDYQRDGQPDAAKELVDIVSKSLVNSGAIRDKFYDRTIRNKIKESNPDAYRYMNAPRRSEDEYDEYKLTTGIIRRPKPLEGRYKESNPKKLNKYIQFKKAYEYTRKHGASFARKYMAVFEAIPYTVKKNVELALANEVDQRDFLQEYQQENNKRIRNRMIQEYGSYEEAKKRQEEFIDKLVQEERNKMEEKMATQLAIDFLAGMTDRSFNNLAIKTGYMTYEQVYNAKRDMKSSQSVQGHLQALEKAEQEEIESETADPEEPEL